MWIVVAPGREHLTLDPRLFRALSQPGTPDFTSVEAGTMCMKTIVAREEDLDEFFHRHPDLADLLRPPLAHQFRLTELPEDPTQAEICRSVNLAVAYALAEKGCDGG